MHTNKNCRRAITIVFTVWNMIMAVFVRLIGHHLSIRMVFFVFIHLSIRLRKEDPFEREKRGRQITSYACVVEIIAASWIHFWIGLCCCCVLLLLLLSSPTSSSTLMCFCFCSSPLIIRIYVLCGEMRYTVCVCMMIQSSYRFVFLFSRGQKPKMKKKKTDETTTNSSTFEIVGNQGLPRINLKWYFYQQMPLIFDALKQTDNHHAKSINISLCSIYENGYKQRKPAKNH